MVTTRVEPWRHKMAITWLDPLSAIREVLEGVKTGCSLTVPESKEALHFVGA